MAATDGTQQGHSSEYFGEERDYFWNSDYLDLLARRLGLHEVASLADVGCGIGHWTNALHRRLKAGAALTGIDRDPANIDGFVRRMDGIRHAGAAVEAIRADALDLPLPSGSFDAVTCQTLLLHLADPAAALREMVRITRPGGLVFCAEPNNLVGRLPFGELIAGRQTNRTARLFEMGWRQALGRATRGLGNECIGEVLPGMFTTLGLQDISVWLCDRAAPLIPPYASAAERAELAAMEAWRTHGIGPFDKDAMRANVLAGGGTEAFFDDAWTDFLAQAEEARQGIANCHYSSAGGGLLYVVAGRVPGHPDCV